MKPSFKIILILGTIAITLVPFLVQAQAGRTTPPPGDTPVQPGGKSNPPESLFTLKNPLKVDSVAGAVQEFIKIISYLLILFAVLVFVWIGFQFIMARGKAERLNELKGHLFWAVIGVAVVIGANVIITIIVNTIQATGTVDPGTIQSIQRAINR